MQLLLIWPCSNGTLLLSRAEAQVHPQCAWCRQALFDRRGTLQGVKGREQIRQEELTFQGIESGFPVSLRKDVSIVLHELQHGETQVELRLLPMIPNQRFQALCVSKRQMWA